MASMFLLGLHERPRFRDRPVAVITGSFRPADRQRAIENGATEYLEKLPNPQRPESDRGGFHGAQSLKRLSLRPSAEGSGTSATVEIVIQETLRWFNELAGLQKLHTE
jgi:CheY-like chemotaxis protein